METLWKLVRFPHFNVCATVSSRYISLQWLWRPEQNRALIGMLCKFLAEDAPKAIKTITVLFLVEGHSCIPRDRIFGRIESDIKRHTTLLTD